MSWSIDEAVIDVRWRDQGTTGCTKNLDRATPIEMKRFLCSQLDHQLAKIVECRPFRLIGVYKEG